MTWRTLLATTILIAASHPTLAQRSAAGEWTMPGKDYSSTRFSALAQINAQNAAKLHPVWTFSTGVLRGHEGQPLVVGDTLYVVTPYPNVLYAFDLRRKGIRCGGNTGRRSANALGIACCDAINRGAVFADGGSSTTCSTATPSRSTPGPAARSGSTKVADITDGETTPMAPLVIKDRVIVGAVRRRVRHPRLGQGARPRTGQVVWTAHNVGPDADMLVRPGTFKPSVRQGTDLGSRPGRSDAWKTGGAPVWGWLSLRSGARSHLLRRRQSLALQRRTARGRQQVDQQRAGAAARGWRTRLGVPVHAARQLGLRLDRREDPRGHADQGQVRSRPCSIRQERLRLHARSGHR